MKAEMWKEAEGEARAWLAFDPGSIEARALLHDILFQVGQRDEADQESRILKALAPR
jgi:hypothetical protein